MGTAPRIVLAAAGGVDHEHLVQLADHNFSALKPTTKEGEYHPCPFTGSEVRMQEDQMPFAHVCMAVQGVSWTNPDYFGLTEEELRRAKDVLKTNFLLQVDGSTPICEDIGRQMITYGRRMPLPEFNYRVDMIDLGVFKNICAKYIFGGLPAITAIGPVGELVDYDTLCRSHRL